MAKDSIELSQLIAHVTRQLREARDKARQDGQNPIIELAECELEMGFSLETGGAAGIKVWLFELGGKRTKTDSNTVRLRFTPFGHASLAFPVVQHGEGPELGPQSEDS